MDVTTLAELLELRSGSTRSITYLEGEHEARRLGFGELHHRALGLLHHLQLRGARRGDALILFLQSNEHFIEAFWACLMGGIVPVPVAVGNTDEHRRKLLRIAAQLGEPWVYADRKPLERIGAFAAAEGASGAFERLAARALFPDETLDRSAEGQRAAVRPGDTAFIQFSSGSTSDPKGVVLTHANLLANWRGAQAAACLDRDDVALSWMPLTHDMGLIGMHIFMLGSDMHLLQMPTDLFVRRPLLWTLFASRHRASILCSPNFGYRHYLKVLGERPLEGLDLAAVRIIFNGAEPVSAALCAEFLDRLASARLRRSAMYPVYGLAEASVAVSFPAPGSPLRVVAVDRHRLQVGAALARLEPGAAAALSLVAVGRAIPHCELRIADDADAALPDGAYGHIQIRGDNVTPGYFDNAAANAALKTADGWTRTGDLGALLDGDLFVAGRAKEIIFVNGQNYYPHDLESLALDLPGLELGKLVIAGLRPPDAATDVLVAFVLYRGDVAELAPLADALVRRIGTQAGLDLEEVVPVRRIPKTTSGKVQRHLLEQGYLDGEYAAETAALRALRAPPQQVRGAGPAAGAEPQGSGADPAAGLAGIEALLCAACSAVLGGQPVTPGDNLLELGASSLKLVEIHERIEALFPGRVGLMELYDLPSPAALARHLVATAPAQPPSAGAG